MRTRSLVLSFAAFAALALSQGANADVIRNEAVDGDLSNSGLAPTLLSFHGGSNQILGSTGDGGSGVDRDYFTFTLAAGQTLTGINLLGNTTVSGSFSFIGIQAGPQVTVDPSGAGGQALLGWTHYSTNDIGSNLLTTISPGGPLSAGTYSVWVQDTGGPVTYGFDFQVAPVPLPAAAWLLTSAMLGLGGIARRKIRSSNG